MEVKTVQDPKRVSDCGRRPQYASVRIGVLMGGMSRERDISLKTGKAIAKALATKGYQAQPIDVTHRIAETLFKEKIDCAFLATARKIWRGRNDSRHV